jgi:hypothetical protein
LECDQPTNMQEFFPSWSVNLGSSLFHDISAKKAGILEGFWVISRRDTVACIMLVVLVCAFPFRVREAPSLGLIQWARRIEPTYSHLYLGIWGPLSPRDIPTKMYLPRICYRACGHARIAVRLDLILPTLGKFSNCNIIVFITSILVVA